MTPHLRIARPVTDLARSTRLYCDGLGLTVLGSFTGHDGFDGVMLGDPAASYHFELTHCPARPVAPAPTVEDLVVLYLPHERAWLAACGQMTAAGFRRVTSFNPYWEARGRTYADHDGYRTVLERAEWSA